MRLCRLLLLAAALLLVFPFHISAQQLDPHHRDYAGADRPKHWTIVDSGPTLAGG